MRQVIEEIERSVSRLVGRDRRGFGPGAVGELVEIVARRDASIHPGSVKSVRTVLRLGRARRLSLHSLRRKRGGWRRRHWWALRGASGERCGCEGESDSSKHG